MEKEKEKDQRKLMNFVDVKNGELRLPPGFRFHPTDEELVVQYLKRKVFSYPLPASIIPDVHVCKSDPWDLPGDVEQERYFFSTREAKYSNGSRSNRATHSGYWKATGLDKQIVTSRGNHVVGMKKTLVFYRGKPPHGSRTDWIMHEYRLQTPPSPSVAMQNWVLCRIFLKRRSGKNNNDEQSLGLSGMMRVKMNNNNNNKSSRPIFYDFLARTETNATTTDLNRTPASSSSATSGITHLSSTRDESEDHEHEEESSSCNSTLPCFRTKP
ncbi:NAC domain-containing protein 83-like [Senna tora]|uniref:NAC domain-containing protein 83-like n=1 Tax=Senna tora TaxID=362788 RepID=A0A834X7A0_9FABA|nr:NAC domain-containing protein 83-like [Senna tora]